MSMQETKLTMLAIWQRHREALVPLVTVTGLPVMTLFSLFIGLAVTHAEAKTVLDAVNTLAGTNYILEDIAGIQFMEQRDSPAEDLRELAIRAFLTGVELEEHPIVEIRFQHFTPESHHLRVLVKTRRNEVALDFPAMWQPWQSAYW